MNSSLSLVSLMRVDWDRGPVANQPDGSSNQYDRFTGRPATHAGVLVHYNT